MKFEEAFSSYAQGFVTIDEIQNIYNSNPVEFTHYIGSFFCPECRQAQLSYNNAAIPYFKAYPNAQHKIGCDLKQAELSKVAAFKFVCDPDNINLIQRQMQSLLNRFFGTSTSLPPREKEKSDTPTNIAGRAEGKQAANKRLPQKRIDLPLGKEDFEYPKYFYGKARICWEKCERKEGTYKILLYHPETRKLLCRIAVSEKVYSHIVNETKYRAFDQCVCGIVILGEAKAILNKPYFTMVLKSSRHIRLEKIKQ